MEAVWSDTQGKIFRRFFLLGFSIVSRVWPNRYIQIRLQTQWRHPSAERSCFAQIFPTNDGSKRGFSQWLLKSSDFVVLLQLVKLCRIKLCPPCLQLCSNLRFWWCFSTFHIKALFFPIPFGIRHYFCTQKSLERRCVPCSPTVDLDHHAKSSQTPFRHIPAPG